jgi:hypothetical protein
MIVLTYGYLFPQALAQWGTDFEMIARLFPHRNRRQIKLKFTREEKFAAAKVTDYLLRKSKPVGKHSVTLFVTSPFALVNMNLTPNFICVRLGPLYQRHWANI